MIFRAILLFLMMITVLTVMFRTNEKAAAGTGKNISDKINMPELKEWNPIAQAAAITMMGKYGMPDEQTESMLIWKNNIPWKSTILYKEEMKHNFPSPHMDVLEQTINCRIPEDKLDDLFKFNGSLTASRTNGTLSVRCLNEHLNILALNFAYEIIKGKKSAGQARLEYYKKAAEIMRGKIPEYAQYLILSNDTSAGDPR